MDTNQINTQFTRTTINTLDLFYFVKSHQFAYIASVVLQAQRAPVFHVRPYRNAHMQANANASSKHGTTSMFHSKCT